MKPQLGRSRTVTLVAWTALLVPCLFAVAGCGDSSETITPAPDTTPPSVPADVVLFARLDYLEITWAPNAEADLAGYQVVRSTDDGATWEPANSSTVITNTFQDGKHPIAQYRVSAVDTSANESAYSSAVGYHAPNQDPKFPREPAEPRI